MPALLLHDLLLGGLTGYLVGSIPFAYILTKRDAGLDVRKHGSGNVGTMNAYEVTGKKSIGRAVLMADVLKGLLPVFTFALMGLSGSLLVLLPALVLGHCYPVWLGFRGGRGLATAAGAVVLLNPPMLVFWGAIFVITWKVRPQVHLAAGIATSLSLLMLTVIGSEVISVTTLPFSGLSAVPAQLGVSIGLALLLILARHVEPILSLMKLR